MTDDWAPPTIDELAVFASASVPAVGRRVRKATVRHNAERWNFEVGRNPTGVYEGSDKRRRGEHLHDSATVLAIFESGSFHIVTDLGLRPGARSEWSNPTWPGELFDIEYFDES
jgi:hypothetical protein